jgi:predicted CXXCH cytochrome family protein
MEFGLLSISLQIPKNSADLINVRVNRRKEVSIVPTREFECFSVQLALGINEIVITASKNDVQTDELSISVFRRSDLVSEYRDPPVGFQKDYFHMTDRTQCAHCHILEPGEADGKSISMSTFTAETFSDRTETAASASTCYSCHKRITSYPFVHGPALVWSCLSCHDPQTIPKYSVEKPDTKVCFKCHAEQGKNWYSKKYIHGPVNTGKCAICHNPHASEDPYNLIMSTWLLCTSCHVEKGSGRHIIAGYVYTDRHPTHGKPDPIREGRELTCASCHESHASDSPRLWTLNVGSGFELCKKCHIK